MGGKIVGNEIGVKSVWSGFVGVWHRLLCQQTVARVGLGSVGQRWEVLAWGDYPGACASGFFFGVFCWGVLELGKLGAGMAVSVICYT